MPLQQTLSNTFRKPGTYPDAEENNAIPFSSSGENDIDFYLYEINRFKFLQRKQPLRELDNTSSYENDQETEFEFEQPCHSFLGLVLFLILSPSLLIHLPKYSNNLILSSNINTHASQNILYVVSPVVRRKRRRKKKRHSTRGKKNDDTSARSCNGVKSISDMPQEGRRKRLRTKRPIRSKKSGGVSARVNGGVSHSSIPGEGKQQKKKCSASRTLVKGGNFAGVKQKSELKKTSHDKPSQGRKKEGKQHKLKRQHSARSKAKGSKVKKGSGNLELCRNEPKREKKCSTRRKSRRDIPNMVMMESNSDEEVQKKRQRKGELRRKKKLRKRRYHCYVRVVKRKWSLRYKKRMQKRKAHSETKETIQVEEIPCTEEQPLDGYMYVKMMSSKVLKPAIPLDNAYNTTIALMSATSPLCPKLVHNFDRPSLNFTKQHTIQHQGFLFDPTHEGELGGGGGGGCEGELGGGGRVARWEEEIGEGSDGSCINDDIVMRPVLQVEQTGHSQRVYERPEADPSEVVMPQYYHPLFPKVTCALIYQSQCFERDQFPDRNYPSPFVNYNEATPPMLITNTNTDDVVGCGGDDEGSS